MATPDGPATQEGLDPRSQKSWSFALVHVSRGTETAAGEAALVLQGVYDAYDEATLATSITGHILADLRRHTQHGRRDEAHPGGACVRVRITIEWLPDV